MVRAPTLYAISDELLVECGLTREFHLLDGLHRWRASQAVGFLQIPAELKTRQFAEVARSYRSPVNGS